MSNTRKYKKGDTVVYKPTGKECKVEEVSADGKKVSVEEFCGTYAAEHFSPKEEPK